MFKVDPDAIYLAKDLREMTGLDTRTLRRCFPMVQMSPPNGRVWMVSGRAILETLQAGMAARTKAEASVAPRRTIPGPRETVPLRRVREVCGT